MILQQLNGLHWHEFELFAQFPIVHGCFTRQGDLNLGNGSASPESLKSHINAIVDAFDLHTLTRAKLCHGSLVSPLPPQDIPISDGLSTKEIGKGIMVTQADCQAAIFYDPIQHVIANVHCGWRSSCLNIYHATVRHLEQKYGSKPENIFVGISPSLGPENAQFINYRSELPESFWQFQVKPFYFDFWAISQWQLVEAGILPHHLQIACIDTFANEADYFSYRRQRPCGRQATLCALKRLK